MNTRTLKEPTTSCSVGQYLCLTYSRRKTWRNIPFDIVPLCSKLLIEHPCRPHNHSTVQCGQNFQPLQWVMCMFPRTNVTEVYSAGITRMKDCWRSSKLHTSLLPSRLRVWEKAMKCSNCSRRGQSAVSIIDGLCWMFSLMYYSPPHL